MARWWTICRPDELMVGRRTVDVNADVGEAATAGGIGFERDLLAYVTSVHVACGGHAGDERSMRDTVAAARAHGVHIGAHPSYPDRSGFGRLPMEMAPTELVATLQEQLTALVEVCRSSGSTVRTVKPHGALYGEVAHGTLAFEALRQAVGAACDPGTILVLPSGSPAVTLARQAGVPVCEEGFCDRAYTAAGTLVDRRLARAVLTDPSHAARQAVDLAAHGALELGDGTTLRLLVDTLCIHGDSPGAVDMARAVRRGLEEAGIGVEAMSSSA
jgi:5-oxoprolinase (ATP-hydrolysing) subunit A